MSDSDEGVPAEVDPEDAFQLFSHELRLEILFALWTAPEFSLPFSDIQDAVDERDSGKFTYHLEQLTDHFVEEQNGLYVLQYPGHRIIDAIQSGVFHTAPTVGPVEAPGTCPECGRSPEFEYDDHLATVSCDDCETKLIEYPFDPGGFQDRSLEAAIRAFDRRTKYKWQLASGGTCFVCAGRVAVSYQDPSSGLVQHNQYRDYFAQDHPVIISLSCRNCSFYSYLPVGIRLLDSPAVVGELASRGMDSNTTLLWELPFVTHGELITVKSQNPWRVDVEAPTATGTVTATLDDATSVESYSVTLDSSSKRE